MMNLESKTTEVTEHINKKLGEYVNYVREQKGISLRTLSQETGLSIALISRLECGHIIPRVESIVKLALALEIPLGDIFGKNACDKQEISPARQDVEIINLLFTMGFDKDSVHSIMDYITYHATMMEKKKNEI